MEAVKKLWEVALESEASGWTYSLEIKVVPRRPGRQGYRHASVVLVLAEQQRRRTRPWTKATAPRIGGTFWNIASCIVIRSAR